MTSDLPQGRREFFSFLGVKGWTSRLTFVLCSMPPPSVHERVFVSVEVTQSVRPQFVFKAFENVTEGPLITVEIFVRVQTKAFFCSASCFQTSPQISEHNE